MNAHSSIVGGSTAGRVLACPPSRLLSEGVRDEESDYARRGSVLHDLMERYLEKDHPRSEEFEDQEMANKYHEAVAAWRDYEQEHQLTLLGAEVSVALEPIPGAFGTIDVLAVNHERNEVHVLDWKFGDGVQVPASSAQNHFYAAAALHDEKTRHHFNAETTVKLAIIQPSMRSEDTVREAETDTLKLFDFTQRLKWAVENGHRDELLASGEHCRFCPARAACPKLRADAQRALEWQDPHDMNAEQVSEALELVEQLEVWIKSIRAYAHECLENDKPVPGWKLVPKRANRHWVDEAQLLEWAKANKVDGDLLYNYKLVTPAALEKSLGVPGHLWEKRSSGTTIAREDDEREPTVSASQLSALAQQLEKINLV